MRICLHSLRSHVRNIKGWVEEKMNDLAGNNPRKREIIDTLLLLEGEDLMLYAKQQLGVDGKTLHFARELQAHKRRLHAQAEEEEAARQRKQRPLKASDPSLELYQKPVLEDEPPKKGKGKKKAQPGSTPGGIANPTNVTVTVKPAKKGGRPLREGMRIACDCQAQEHTLITNCLECGRIICMQEGRGPCLFCGSDVDSQHLVQQQRSEASAKEREGFFKALAQRNQLVEYDRTSAQRTMVYGASLYAMLAEGTNERTNEHLQMTRRITLPRATRGSRRPSASTRRRRRRRRRQRPAGAP